MLKHAFCCQCALELLLLWLCFFVTASMFLVTLERRAHKHGKHSLLECLLEIAMSAVC